MAKPVTRLIIPSEEDNIKLMKMAEEYGYCTVWDLCKKYNINKQKICRYIRSGKLLGFMKTFTSSDGKEYTECKWYIIKNQALTEFIEKENSSSL